jgi:hypothetical protein
VNKTAEEISRERAGVEPEKENGHAFSHHLDPVSHRILNASFVKPWSNEIES